MDDGILSFFQTILGLIPFLLALLAFGLYIIVHSWKMTTIQDLVLVRDELRRGQIENARIRKIGEAFSTEDPEPFGQLAQNLSDQLVQIDQLIRTLYDRYAGLHARANRLNKPDWRGWIWLPRDWRTLKIEVRDLTGEVGILNGLLVDAAKLGMQLNQFGQETASRSRELIDKIHQAKAIFKQIQESGIEGDLIETASLEIAQWENTLLTQIPVVFFSPKGEASQNETDKESISRVHRVLTAASQPIESIFTKALEWEKLGAEFRQGVAEIHQTNTILAKRMNELEKQPLNPLIWEKSRSQFDSLLIRSERIGPVEKIRTLEQMQAGIGTIQSIISRQKELTVHCEKVREDYVEILSLWSKPELQQGTEWVRKTKSIMAEVTNFDPENWPKEDNVLQFANELKELNNLQEKVVPRSAAITVKESEMAPLLDSVRRLAVYHQKLRPKLVSIQNRLSEIRLIEKGNRDELVKVRAFLSQIIALINANVILKKTVGAEGEKYRASVDQMILDFDQAENGTVQKKAQKTSNLIQRIQQSVNRWLTKLTEELDGNITSLSDGLTLLREVSTLDDPILEEAGNLVREMTAASIKNPQLKSSPLSLQEAVIGLRQKNEAWQRSVACTKALEDIAGPVLDRYKKADKNRQAALEKYQRADKAVPEIATWPPTTQTMTQERQQFQNLERQWASLRQGKLTSLQLVSKLSDMSEQYHALAIEFGQIIERAEQEQIRIKDFDQRLQESKKLWQQQAISHSENRILKDSIQNLLNEIDKDYENLKARYARGSYPYNQALQGLRQICRKIDDALMPVGGNQVIDINGVEQKRLY